MPWHWHKAQTTCTMIQWVKLVWQLCTSFPPQCAFSTLLLPVIQSFSSLSLNARLILQQADSVHCTHTRLFLCLPFLFPFSPFSLFNCWCELNGNLLEATCVLGTAEIISFHAFQKVVGCVELLYGMCSRLGEPCGWWSGERPLGVGGRWRTRNQGKQVDQVFFKQPKEVSRSVIPGLTGL